MLQRTLGRAATLPLIRRPRSTSPGARRARGEGGSNLKTRRRPMANKATGGHKVTRRQVLKGAVATATAAAGSRITGFPTVWAQNIKDIKLVQAGGSFSPFIDIRREGPKGFGVHGGKEAAGAGGPLERLRPPTQPLDNAPMGELFL